mgnify:CR=1 FL=1
MSRAPISIHAPAKGATGLGGSNRVFVSDFNPRTREGCDVNMKKERGPRNLFQSTHPRRVRRTKYDYTCRCVLFQSTHPRRVRHARDKDQWQRSKFQSTHPRRVRHVRCLHLSWYSNQKIFQSTHPRRVRLHFYVLIIKLNWKTLALVHKNNQILL